MEKALLGRAAAVARHLAGLISILISLAIVSGGVLYADRRFDEK